MGTSDALVRDMRTNLLACLAIVAGSGLAACDDDDNNNNNNTDAENRAIDQGNTRGQALTVQAQGEFQGSSEPDVLAKSADIVATINTGEIAQASFVLSKTSNSDVRDLASQILADHQMNNAALQSMMQSRGLAPVSNAVSRTLQDEANTGLAQLMADAPGALDRDYVEMQVMMHQEGFVIVGNLRGYTQAVDMQNFLSDTLDAIDAHRQHARDVLHDLP
jgi:predicted outer membrane protein